MPIPAARTLSILLCCTSLGCASLACAGLAGCKLVDQRTFDRNAGRTPVPHEPPKIARAVPALPPLIVVNDASLIVVNDASLRVVNDASPRVVNDASPGAAWQADVRSAVSEALKRKPNVLFTVETVVPEAASPAKQAESLRAAIASRGRPVADEIIADGAAPSQVEMTALTDPAARAPEVRVFVR